jgi:putative zinc finger protein
MASAAERGGHVQLLLGAYVLGGLSEAEEAAVRAHLDRCALCRAEHEELAEVPPWLDLLGALGLPDDEDFGEDPGEDATEDAADGATGDHAAAGDHAPHDGAADKHAADKHAAGERAVRPAPAPASGTRPLNPAPRSTP